MPRDLFERPANLFVAEHLGQPTINVIDAEIVRRRRSRRCASRPARWFSPCRIDTARRWRCDPAATGALTLGLRPQYVRPADEGAAGVRDQGARRYFRGAWIDRHPDCGRRGSQADGAHLSGAPFRARQPDRASIDTDLAVSLRCRHRPRTWWDPDHGTRQLQERQQDLRRRPDGGPCGQGSEPRDRGRGVRGAARSVGLRQDLDAADGGRPRDRSRPATSCSTTSA